jgi:hypothetical protein
VSLARLDHRSAHSPTVDGESLARLGEPPDPWAPAADGEVGPTAQLVLFQVATSVFATAARDVVRIGTVREMAAGELVLDSALGTPFDRERGLVVVLDGVERALVVDRVLGTRAVPAAAVQPLPAFAAACIHSGALAGLVLVDEIPTPLVDIPTLVRERGAAAAPPPT